MIPHISNISTVLALSISLATASVLPKDSQVSNSTKQWTFDEVCTPHDPLPRQKELPCQFLLINYLLDSSFSRSHLVSMFFGLFLCHVECKHPPTIKILTPGCWHSKLQVPLDYSKPSGTRASVPLIMIAAQNNSTDGPYQGMLLTNPGILLTLVISYLFSLHDWYFQVVLVMQVLIFFSKMDTQFYFRS